MLLFVLICLPQVFSFAYWSREQGEHLPLIKPTISCFQVGARGQVWFPRKRMSHSQGDFHFQKSRVLWAGASVPLVMEFGGLVFYDLGYGCR